MRSTNRVREDVSPKRILHKLLLEQRHRQPKLRALQSVYARHHSFACYVCNRQQSVSKDLDITRKDRTAQGTYSSGPSPAPGS